MAIDGKYAQSLDALNQTRGAWRVALVAVIGAAGARHAAISMMADRFPPWVVHNDPLSRPTEGGALADQNSSVTSCCYPVAHPGWSPP
jgi:hypothetical protein